MTKLYQESIDLPAVKRRRIRIDFGGSHLTSDAGAHLLRLVDRRLGLTSQLAKRLPDDRVAGRCQHSLRDMLRQRIYGLALGYEDLNDSEQIRYDPALRAAAEVPTSLASPATLCRLEQRAGRIEAMAMHEVLVEQFIASYDKPPKRLILDIDATDNPVHGMQEGRHFMRYYDSYCFLPLYVYCGKQLLVSYLRPASRSPAFHASAVISLLVRRLREVSPKVQIVLRADAGFCVPRLLHWCDRRGVDYVIGIGKNSRLLTQSTEMRGYAESLHELTGKKQRWFSEFYYQARSWPHERRVIVKAEHNESGANPRFIVTSLNHTARWLYTRFYCARGDMENRIKEQIQLFSTRTSCHRWWPNQFRLLLSSMSYVLLERLRALALQETEPHSVSLVVQLAILPKFTREWAV
ncbi:IS1380 family transposase [Microbulbifer halophilus]|uniref:IS1380 family transposase n=1 Tax=Microbulbifer halophilus TaxID=453963 RepID=UPI003615E7BD